jgi:hypothetical protein
MAGLFQVKDVESRKRALITESEVYRETLKLEVQNLQLYSVRMRRRLSFVGTVAPLVLLARPLTGLFLQKRVPTKRGLFGTAILGWRLYRQFAPVLGALLQRFAGRKHQRVQAKESYEPRG